ncbi:TPA: d-alanine-poly(phosphoribitol) ligase [Neisseria meningitidis]|uniref:NMB0938 family lipoprotein n=1 Tax=Neisseria meningitidis TaxID=487 RepID=UPI000E57A5BF|nr:d-alanine-poly(phosphoribitol) ligase [Neisseria meningitidis]
MKNKTSSLLLWLAAMMLTACSPSKEDKTKENGASAASSTASAASSSAPQTDLQPAASAPDNVKQAESVPPSNCTDLHPATGIDDLMQQIAEHIDSDCLFALSHHELETRFGLPGGGYDNIQRLLFPDIRPEDPDYHQKIILAIEDLRYGKRTISRQAQNALMEQERRLREATLLLIQGSQETRGQGEEPKRTRYFEVSATPAYSSRHNNGLGGNFQYISQLPGYLKIHGEMLENQSLFRLSNRERNPDKPFLDIHFDENGKITRIVVYEKNIYFNPNTGRI